MNAIRSVFVALSNLASSINGLANVLDVATGRLRQQLALDGESAPILEHHSPTDDKETQIAKGKKAKA